MAKRERSQCARRECGARRSSSASPPSARATRPTDKTSPDFVRAYVDTGAGPRAGQYLVLAAKSRAVMSGRLQPQVEDVRAAAVSVLAT